MKNEEKKNRQQTRFSPIQTTEGQSDPILPLLMSASVNYRANRDFEKQIDHMVTTAAVCYHKEVNSFLDSSCAITKHRDGPIKGCETFFTQPPQAGSEEVRVFTGETRI